MRRTDWRRGLPVLVVLAAAGRPNVVIVALLLAATAALGARFEPTDEAIDGASSAVLWTSTCTMPEWGETNQLGRVFGPALHDINEDGLDDGFPTGSVWEPVKCKMLLTAGENFTLDYESPVSKVPTRRVDLDSATGNTISNEEI
jgi:hypothetical protein